MKTFVGILFIICLLCFLWITLNVIVHKNDALDLKVVSFISLHRKDWMVAAMRKLTFFGSGNFLVPAYLFLMITLLYVKQKYDALAVLLVSVSSLLIISELKLFFHRHRPDLPLIPNIATFSFPSGHSFSSVIFFGIIAFVLRKKLPASSYRNLTILLILLCPLLIGLSRMILNVHYFTDVLSGFCLGFIWLVISYSLLYRKRSQVASARPD